MTAQARRFYARKLILSSEGLDQNAGLGHFTGVALTPFAKR